MKKILISLILFLGIISVSIFLTPILASFLPYKFERIFYRIVMISSIAAALIFVRISSETLSRFGLAWQDKKSISGFLTGFVSGVAVLTGLACLKILSGHASWNLSNFHALSILWKTIQMTLTGLLIGLLEEFFFRGFIFMNLTRRFKWNLQWSVIVTSLFYSILHFVDASKPPLGENPGLKESFLVAMTPILSMSKFPEFWPAALGLFLFGIVLNDLVVRTNSLYASIGLHAGCVLFVKMESSFFSFTSNQPLFWGTGLMYDSFVGWLTLILLGFMLRLFISKQENREAVYA